MSMEEEKEKEERRKGGGKEMFKDRAAKRTLRELGSR
jgi:hypothetical protein